MLEILFVVSLWKKMGEMMRNKGYNKPFWFQFFVPVFWFGGEVFGAFVVAIVRAIQGQRDTGFDLFLYLFALLGAGVGAGVIFLIASSFSRRTEASPPLVNQ